VTTDEPSIEEATKTERTLAADIDETAEIEEATEADQAPVDGTVEAEAGVDETIEAEESAGIDDEVDATRPRKRLVGKIVAAVAASLAVLVSLGLLGWVVYFWYLPDRDVDAAAAKAAVTAASEGTVAVLSYGPETLDNDLSAAKSHLTGGFLKDYTQFTDNLLKVAVKEKSVKATAVVLRAALQELDPDKAVALVFVNESNQSKDKPEPTYRASIVTVTMTKVDGKWLISEFTPI